MVRYHNFFIAFFKFQILRHLAVCVISASTIPVTFDHQLRKL